MGGKIDFARLLSVNQSVVRLGERPSDYRIALKLGH